jgi:hypothetical protein
MKYYRFWPALCLGTALVCPLLAEQVATVTGSRVNVRGQATLGSEVITQLKSGDRVVVLEEITATDPKVGEPTRWARIQLPESTSVFVFAPYVDPVSKTVKVSRLNLRGGPGENFSVLGRLTRGTRVTELQTTGSWMEIETPPEAHAFVAMDFLETEEPTATAAPRPATTPAAPTATPPAQWPPTVAPPTATPTEAPAVATVEPTVEPAQPETDVAAVESEPVLIEPDDWPGVTPPSEDDWPRAQVPAPQLEAAPTVPTFQPEPPVEPTPRRVVIREGRVVFAFSPQAPTRYGLMSLETQRIINFLHSEVDGLNLRAFSGRDVFVTGEELLDARWVTPIIEVEDIRLAPKR